MTVSKNGVGVVVFVLSLLGVTVSDSDVATTISTIMQIVSALLLAWNQAKRSDSKWFIFKE